MKRLTTEEVIEKSKSIYGDKYDYSKIEYINYDTKITVICQKHGDFKIRPDHFFKGCGCPKCGNERCGDKNRTTIEKFIETANKIHNFKYDYSKVNYVDAKTKICVICPLHGDFLQTPDMHLRGAGCPKCSHRSYKYTTQEFIEMAKNIHGDKYDYSKVLYHNRKTPVCIICPNHGEYWQRPFMHLRGHGCIYCNESHLENEIEQLLKQQNIKYEKEKRFPWLRSKYPMPLDFYLPDYNIGIECQGEQHFKDKDFFKNYSFEDRVNLDLLKNKLCEENGVTLFYYSNKYFVPHNWDKYKVICSKTKLLENIKLATKRIGKVKIS